MGDRAGLAGAGAGQHADGSAQRQGDLALLGVERAEQVVGEHGNELRPFRVGSVTSVDAREDTHDRRSPDEPGQHSFTMYTTPWCGYCHRLKSQLDREGIAYDVVDIEQDPAAADIVMPANRGNQTVPTLVYADGTAQTNPSRRAGQGQARRAVGVMMARCHAPSPTLDWPLRTDRLLIRAPTVPEDAEAMFALRDPPGGGRCGPTRSAHRPGGLARPLHQDPELARHLLSVERDGQVVGELMVRVRDGWAQKEVEPTRATAIEAELGWLVDAGAPGHRGWPRRRPAPLLELCFDRPRPAPRDGRHLRRTTWPRGG